MQEEQLQRLQRRVVLLIQLDQSNLPQYLHCISLRFWFDENESDRERERASEREYQCLCVSHLLFILLRFVFFASCLFVYFSRVLLLLVVAAVLLLLFPCLSTSIILFNRYPSVFSLCRLTSWAFPNGSAEWRSCLLSEQFLSLPLLLLLLLVLLSHRCAKQKQKEIDEYEHLLLFIINFVCLSLVMISVTRVPIQLIHSALHRA